METEVWWLFQIYVSGGKAHTDIFSVLLVHANDMILLHYEKGLDKPLNHVKAGCGLAFLGSVPALRTRASGTYTSMSSAASDSKMHNHGPDNHFSYNICAFLHFKTSYSLQFHISQCPHRPFLLALSCLPFISTFFPSETRLLPPVLGSSPRVSLCPLLFQQSISTPLHASGFWDQLLKSALHFSPQALQYPSAQLLWIILSNAALEHRLALFA